MCSCRRSVYLMPSLMRRAEQLLPLLPVAALVCAGFVNSKWPVKFTESAAKARLTAVNVSGDTASKKYILEMNGSGLAFLDYDGDGYVDLFVVNGTRLERTAGTSEAISHLYRNKGN